MKFLSLPNHDDFLLIKTLSVRATLKSYPHLLAELQRIEDQYTWYDLYGGNAWQLDPPLLLSDQLIYALKLHYNAPPAGLEIIEVIRNLGSPTVCPMCGSLKPSQVDHVAPKDIYPEFSFYSRNLVPACDCNGIKKLAYKGQFPGERILHPYYDEVLRKRLAFLYFSGDLTAPKVDVLISPDHQMNMAVRFHLDQILRKTRIFFWANSKWATLLRKPEKFFPALKYHTEEVGFDKLLEIVSTQLENSDEIYETPNNWESMFLMGIIQSHNVINFIVQHIRMIRNGELVPT